MKQKIISENIFFFLHDKGTEGCSYPGNGRAARWEGESGSGPSLSCTRSGWWRVFLTPLCARWRVSDTSGCSGDMQRWRTHRNQKQNQETKKRGRRQTGREQREGESSVNEQVQGRGGEVEHERRPTRETNMPRNCLTTFLSGKTSSFTYGNERPHPPPIPHWIWGFHTDTNED